MTEKNIADRSSRPSRPSKLALANVRVFDGTSLRPPSTVIIDGSHIGNANTDGKPVPTYDAQGKTLLPGLIDSHAHPMNADHLEALTRYGITTAVNAFCPDPAFCTSLLNHPGLTSLLTASFIATSPNSTHAKLVGPSSPLLIHNTSQIPEWVGRQVAQGADFIKVVGSAPGPGLLQAAQTALTEAAHAAGWRVVLHAASRAAYEQGLAAGADQIHHAPLDVAVSGALLESFARKRRDVVVCPTLTMMRATVEAIGGNKLSFAAATETVARLHRAGVTILAGSDANLQPGTPAQVQFGSSLHDELENLVAAGLSPVEALNAATVLPARYFGLEDRGVVREGMLADLLLVDGDPTVDIRASRNVVKVWVRGVEFDSQHA
ncbi:uncharacterized protein THITE_2088123 [Thermothielavioides terrestris NRRL 8126]|uniref:Amidohydrolase-related domain-containing protein n=2 Tax=Thermothielavioides terrestris TaxID=2587410 RepID=G2R256_THETT|nr:uncharacterized protein THITE_2088123 [Thermothielavioides terrestris NRRL 8126]AEO66640.1 hypothetical protein THITE_2088123 [Thermothielavioides terrestris NRRL 8126]